MYKTRTLVVLASLISIFRCPELAGAIMDHVRATTEPVVSRDIVREIVALRGDDARDRKYLSDLTKGVSKALRALKADGRVSSISDRKSHLMWKTLR